MPPVTGGSRVLKNSSLRTEAEGIQHEEEQNSRAGRTHFWILSPPDAGQPDSDHREGTGRARDRTGQPRVQPLPLRATRRINGMSGTVLGMNGDNVIVRTEQNVRISVHAWTDPVTGIVHYPFRLGYASTLHKVQGATLPHITLWLDSKKPMPAAGYVALSRVTHDAHWQYVGDPNVHDFEAAHF